VLSAEVVVVAALPAAAAADAAYVQLTWPASIQPALDELQVLVQPSYPTG
jgi:hypothetical protein